MKNPKGTILGLTLAALVLATVADIAGKKGSVNWTQDLDIILFGSISMMVADWSGEIAVGSMIFLLIHQFISGGGAQAFTDIVGGLKTGSASTSTTGKTTNATVIPNAH